MLAVIVMDYLVMCCLVLLRRSKMLDFKTMTQALLSESEKVVHVEEVNWQSGS